MVNAFFGSDCNGKTSCSPGTQPSELKDRDRNQNEASIILGQMVSDLLHHSDIHKSMEPNGIHPRVLRYLWKCSLSYFQSLSAVLANWRGPS